MAILLAGEQQFAVAVSSVVVIRAVAVLGDVHVLDPYLPVDDHTIGISQATLALANRLNLGASEHNAGREGLDDLVIKRGLAVLDIDCIIVIVI